MKWMLYLLNRTTSSSGVSFLGGIVFLGYCKEVLKSSENEDERDIKNTNRKSVIIG